MATLRCEMIDGILHINGEPVDNVASPINPQPCSLPSRFSDDVERSLSNEMKTGQAHGKRRAAKRRKR